jgi:uncharacterized membrane protein required for colicin V production
MIYKGLRVGVGGQLLFLVGWLLILFTTLSYYSIVSKTMFGFLLQRWSRPASFLAIAVFVFFIIKAIERFIEATHEGEFAYLEKVAGALVACLRAILLFGMIGMLLLLVPVDFTRDTVMRKSKTGMFFVNANAKIYSLMTGYFGLSEKKTKSEVMKKLLSSQQES